MKPKKRLRKTNSSSATQPTKRTSVRNTRKPNPVRRAATYISAALVVILAFSLGGVEWMRQGTWQSVVGLIGVFAAYVIFAIIIEKLLTMIKRR